MALDRHQMFGVDSRVMKTLTNIFNNWLPSAALTWTNKTLTSPTLTTPAITGGTQNSPTITTPVFSGEMGGNVLQSAEHAAGAIGTGPAPKTYRRTENGVIITTIKIDLTGLGITGTTQGYAIGLVTDTPAAYIGRNVVATNGIIFRIDMVCIEPPAGSATVELDIDLGVQTSGEIAYGEEVDAEVIAAGIDWAAGNTVQSLLPALTANDYFYLTAGDTAGDGGVYTAGQFIITMYGHPALT